MSESRKGCLLKREGGITEVDIPYNIDLDNFNFHEPFQSRGMGNLTKLGDWLSFDDVVILYGWRNGRAGQENKHEIPPPFDTELYFGDLLCVRLDDNGHLADFDSKTYDSFQEMAFGGFTSLENDSEEEETMPTTTVQESDQDSEYQPRESETEDSSETDSDAEQETDLTEELVEEPDSDIVDWSEESSDSQDYDSSGEDSASLIEEDD